MRQLTPRQKAALRTPGTVIATFVEFGHPSGTEYYWSGSGTVEHDGHNWIGAGLIAGVSGVENSTEPRVSQVGFVMTGVPSDALNVASTDLKGYQATLYLGIMSAERRVVDHLETVNVVDLDTQSTQAQDDGSFTIVCTGQAGFWQLENPSLLLWSPESQKADYPGDTGMDALAELEDLEEEWTRT